MEIASIIVILIIAFGLILTVIFLLSYLIKGKKLRLRKAALSFTTAVFSFLLLIGVEELFFSYNFEDKEEVLVASREAPIGGIVLKLYADKTFEIGGFREVKSIGTFELNSDTLLITSINKKKNNKYITQASFIIKEGYLEEIEASGIGFLEIHVNRLK